jgi:hypothetical protein
LPDISKINALAIGSVSKVDGLAKASILDINGITVTDPGINPTAPTSGFLFTYSGGDAAFSVRQLNNNADQIMRVRRASDNVEADVGFDGSNELSLTSPISNTSDAQSYTDLSDFVDHTGTPTNAFVRYWYDQTGLQKHAEQSTAGSQPKMYDATTGLIEEGSVGNEKPALQLDGTDDYLEFPASYATNFYYSVFAVRQSSGTNDLFFSTDNTNRYWADYGADGQTQQTIQDGFNGPSAAGDYVIYRKNGAAAFTTTTTRDQYHTAFYNGNQILMSFLTDGSASVFPFTSLMIGAYDGPSLHFGGTVQELIMYQSTTGNESGNASGIEGNINTHFSIY